MGLLWKQAELVVCLCVRITDSSHTSFPLTFVPVPISVHLKYPEFRAVFLTLEARVDAFVLGHEACGESFF